MDLTIQSMQTTKTITEQQTQELFKFTRQHFVEWYDLQCELVDHLANDIEQIWEEHPNLSFEDAKIRSFKKFGVFGFMDVVEKKSKAMNKRYLKMFWKAFKTFFTIPKIILTLTAFALILKAIQWSNHNYYVVLSILITSIAVPFYIGFKYSRKIKRKQEQTGRKYLFEMMLHGGAFMLSLNLVVQIMILLDDAHIKQWSLTADIVYSACFVLLIVCFVVIFIILPPKITEILAEEHPEYELA